MEKILLICHKNGKKEAEINITQTKAPKLAAIFKAQELLGRTIKIQRVKEAGDSNKPPSKGRDE